MKALSRGTFRKAAMIFEGTLLTSGSSDALVLRLLHDTYAALGDSPALRGSVARAFQVGLH